MATLREMTSAEFTGQIASLAEPVRVKRYKAVLGDWYPGGHECAAESVVRMGQVAPAAMEAARASVEGKAARIAELEESNRNLTERLHDTSEALTVASDEIARLKRQLAQRTSGEPRYAPGTPEPPTRPNSIESFGLSREAQREAQDAILARDRRLRALQPKPKGRGE